MKKLIILATMILACQFIGYGQSKALTDTLYFDSSWNPVGKYGPVEYYRVVIYAENWKPIEKAYYSNGTPMEEQYYYRIEKGIAIKEIIPANAMLVKQKREHINVPSSGISVEGRKVNRSTLVKPSNNYQESGKIVVKVWIDIYGNVKKAIIDEGTTIKNTKMIAEARAAAMKAHFDQKLDAPAMQEGTITYTYSLQ